ncbi:repulsive guidance molecule B-like isoform X2 [Dermacentor silvarum]|uniref:repulsive guidance molecule B-like isoform X2 n=1 Tax=Dermacentor silvarum TaxID=543639 RepID=UPI00189A7B90|nr:repulsive guidance molecule B-like isoform X2 [Dermacentor silvarum]XP_049518186.1 repulsive guidance molecule B-like isoform X2 [Dermacentor silvarum]XP_049518187.1 repulsive guidance molecule B-like isoform X2 [Dermacentor silvarum]
MGHHAPLLLRWLLFTFALFSTATSSDECGFMNCYANYKDGSCEFRSCLNRLAKECAGDIKYRAAKTSLSKLNCSDVVATETSKPRPTKETCLWRSGEPKEEWLQCSLYGDTHLRTFGGELQTCRAKGARPLVDNAYLAVQVTNSAIGDKATVLSKVTVVIHAHGGCAMEKTYEADIKDNPLPTVFVDGSPSAGKGVRLAPLSSSRVELVLSHAGVRLLIRRQGDFLSVALRLPSSLAGDQPLQLCLRGCSSSERVQAPLGEPAWRLEEADAACRAANLTGAYRDACVFDVLATGQKDMAAEASGAAVADLLELGAAAEPHVVQQPSVAAERRASVTAVLANLLLIAWLRAGSCSEVLGAVR